MNKKVEISEEAFDKYSKTQPSLPLKRSDVNSALASGLQYTYDVLREIYEGETSVKKSIKAKKSEKKI